MQCSVEITYYPLRESYLAPIEAFCRHLEDAAGLEVTVTPMSTQVYGEWTTVMATLTDAMAPALADAPGAFVMKVLGMDARRHERPERGAD